MRRGFTVKALLVLAALPLVACSNISAAIPTTTPVLLGPMDRIGGKPLAEPTGDKEFDGEDEMSLLVCVSSGYPTMSSTHPQGGASVANSLKEGLALHAGERPLQALDSRLTRLGTGAWVMFFAGCYGQAWWRSARGTTEVAQ